MVLITSHFSEWLLLKKKKKKKKRSMKTQPIPGTRALNQQASQGPIIYKWFPVWGSSNWQSGFMMYSLGISIGWWESILCWARDDTEFGQLVYIVCLLLCSNPCRKYYFHWRGEKHFENVCFVFSSVLCLGW